ncbi:RNA polymerase sigma factor RpoE [Novipirellula aureliae]|uniref:RNA polymerase sigma factor RpoE n=1 Tax=Novipirellula aureliae TaxID=2527966 RepID=A0A5C6E611_9BACT|nr:sigma factor [Novipirellula aureliae]TWU44270.1 RNA polymerase sigma factor RpoE [Novipirellula aureliae]
MSLDSEHSEFARLIAQHGRSVRGYIMANVPRFSDADEDWQEATVRLWLEFDKFEPASNFAAWAIRVAYFVILTSQRIRKSLRRCVEQRLLNAELPL